MEQRGRADGGVAVTWQSVDEYLASLTQRGCSPDTVRAYRRCLARLYRFLPGDKLLRRGTLELWRGELLQTYTPRTVNVNVSAVNSYLEHIGAREFQLARPLPPPEDDQPEITRAEYLRMLGSARQDGNERAYLLTKVFACTGLTVQELPCVTARAVAEGRVEPPGGEERAVKLPECLRRELSGYMSRHGVRDGPVFVTRSGQRMSRTAVTDCIQRLAASAHIAPGKGNPRCLRKLYLAAQKEIWDSLRPMADQAHERLIDTEQMAVGWPEREE